MRFLCFWSDKFLFLRSLDLSFAQRICFWFCQEMQKGTYIGVLFYFGMAGRIIGGWSRFLLWTRDNHCLWI